MFRKKEKGFTLIELMIVVAIIGILAAIAIPRFADLIKKSKEGATKGNLGALRSALSIYYGEQEGYYPTGLTDVLNPNYIESIPAVKTGPHSGAAHADGLTSVTPHNDCAKKDDATITDVGGWGYWKNNAQNVMATLAGVFVECTGSDSKGETIHDW